LLALGTHPPTWKRSSKARTDVRTQGRHCTQHPCGSTIFGAGPGCMHDGICLIASVGWSMPSASGLSAAVSPREMMDGTLNIEISNIEYRISNKLKFQHWHWQWQWAMVATKSTEILSGHRSHSAQDVVQSSPVQYDLANILLFLNQCSCTIRCLGAYSVCTVHHMQSPCLHAYPLVS